MYEGYIKENIRSNKILCLCAKVHAKFPLVAHPKDLFAQRPSGQLPWRAL